MNIVYRKALFPSFFRRERGRRPTIYLDYAAATPLHPLVKRAMEPFLTSQYGNPSSLHHKGVEARRAVEEARKTIAKLIDARPQEIIFTSGGTESCNLAILGSAQALIGLDRPGHIITTRIEHHAVLESVRALQKQGWQATFLPVDGEGFINIDDFKQAVRKNTRLVSLIYANNEIGTIEPVAEIGRIIFGINAERVKSGLTRIVLHTDACQAAGSLDLNVNRLQVDLMSVSASKIYGPKGVGFLYVRRDALISPILHGGGQEGGLRSGTENVAGIAGMAKAIELAVKHQDSENKRLVDLRDYLIGEIRKNFPKAILNGPQPTLRKNIISSKSNGRDNLKISGSGRKGISKLNRLPNNINFTIPGAEGEALMLYLDAQGICVSTGSACASGSTDASHVLIAIGRSQKQAKESIRITLGKETKKTDIDYFIETLKKVIPLIFDVR